MSDPKITMDTVGVTLVNTVTNQGVADGVFNINFATALFTPVANDKIETELVISCRLRMGPQCLMQLKQSVDFLVDTYLKKTADMPPAAVEGTHANKPN